jgi:TolB protein
VDKKCNFVWMVTLSVTSLLLIGTANQSFAQSSPVGIFENHQDVGTVLHTGSTQFDSAKKSYTITGSGTNMWFAEDDFQFAWKKMSGDVSLTAEISFATTTGNEHKKAALMIRQTLDADSVYADIARHGNGMTALQFRDEKGATTREVVSNIAAPTRLRIVKHGDYIYMALADKGGDLQVAGGWIKIPIQGTFYVGLGVCSHDKDASETAIFSNVDLTVPAAMSGKTTLYSSLSVVPVAGPDVAVVHIAPAHFEAPNWSHDGKYFLFNQEGRILKLPVDGGKPETLDTGFATRVNNDHGISPDGTQLVISDQSQGDKHESQIYILPLSGGTPKRITENSPSYWHAWSPDGKTLAFARRQDVLEFDIYSIPVTGGQETRLTTTKGIDDGPEYSPDGNYIYFNSVRSGLMQIWRMKPDGSGQEQVFNDEYNNWFPHISPDGKWMVFVSYDKSVEGHPANKDVVLRMMSLADQKITVLARLFGGQGTINVPSWSPDSKRVAFVSYQLIPNEDLAGK